MIAWMMSLLLTPCSTLTGYSGFFSNHVIVRLTNNFIIQELGTSIECIHALYKIHFQKTINWFRYNSMILFPSLSNHLTDENISMTSTYFHRYSTELSILHKFKFVLPLPINTPLPNHEYRYRTCSFHLSSTGRGNRRLFFVFNIRFPFGCQTGKSYSYHKIQYSKR